MILRYPRLEERGSLCPRRASGAVRLGDNLGRVQDYWE
jgi:hypothetical protein